MKKENNSGFSLVELIIVIAIMAVLVGVLAPQFIKFVEKSRESTDLQTVAEAKTAVETYVADKGCSATFVVEFTGSDPKTAVLKVSASGTGAPSGTDFLKIYGIPDSTKVGQLKSAEWKNGPIKWTYENFSWTLNSNTAQAKYIKADGTEIDS